MSALPEENYSLCEAVADLAHNFAFAPLWPGNSREFVRLCIEWAEIFEARNVDREWDGEYIEEIDAFFIEQYKQWVEEPVDADGRTPNPTPKMIADCADVMEAHGAHGEVNLPLWTAYARLHVARITHDAEEVQFQIRVIDRLQNKATK